MTKPKKLPRKLQQRRAVIIQELSHMSRNGWRDAKPCDYQPLEQELRDIERKAK